jgi:hypothetical protein
MHIHAGQLNASQMLHGTHPSTELAQRRAEETRKKLLASAIELDQTAPSDSPWAVSLAGAWSGDTPNGSADASPADAAADDRMSELSPALPIGMVSFWA